MKIVFVIDSWNEGNGGIITTRRLVKALIERGHDITIVATGQHKGDFTFYEIPGFYIPPLKESMQNMNFLFGIGKKRTLKQAYKGADIVHVQFPFLLARNAVKVAKKMGIPVIGGFHVQPQNVVAASGKDSKLMEKIFTSIFNWSLFNQVETVQCPSQFAAELLQSLGSKARTEVISNGILEQYQQKEFKRPEWIGDKFTIIYVGRHAREKRQTLLVEAVAKSKYKDNIQLILCGKGEDSETLIEMGKELPVPPMVEYVSEEDKIMYLNISDLYVHPSIVELESLSSLEAVGCGTPCLISNSPYSAAPQFAIDDTFLFNPDDPDHLAERINYHFEKKHALKEHRKTIIEMSKNYRFEQCIDKFEKLYQDTIANAK